MEMYFIIGHIPYEGSRIVSEIYFEKSEAQNYLDNIDKSSRNWCKFSGFDLDSNEVNSVSLIRFLRNNQHESFNIN